MQRINKDVILKIILQPKNYIQTPAGSAKKGNISQNIHIKHYSSEKNHTRA